MPPLIQLGGASFEVARVFCIGRNYAAHAAELGNAVPGEPVVFMKPRSAVVPHGAELQLPQARGSVHHETELVFLVGSDGATGMGDVAGVSLGLDLTLRGEQARLKAKGLPWELAKAFDGSAPLGEFVPLPADLSAVAFDCVVNGELRQHGEVRNMLFSPDRLVAFLASRFRLQRGDLVFTGTPQGVGPLASGDVIEISSTSIGRFTWRCR